MNSCAIGVAVQCRPRRHFLRSLSPATEHAKLGYRFTVKGKDSVVQMARTGVLLAPKRQLPLLQMRM